MKEISSFDTLSPGKEPMASSTMGFWDHADALKMVLVRIALILAVLVVIVFSFMNEIFVKIILAPCFPDFPLYDLFHKITSLSSLLPDFSNEGFKVDLININLASQFFVHISTSFWLALIISCPISLYFLWTFVRPALYEQEKGSVRTAFVLGNVMFYLGMCVGYFIVFPITLRFLSEYHVSHYIVNQLSLDSYIDNFLGIIFIMGVVFELPLLCWVLGKLGLIDRHFFTTYRRHAIVILLILAAFITPTGDPFTLMVVFMPIYLLWEISSKLVPKKAKETAVL